MGGLAMIFLGILTAVMSFLSRQFGHIQAGIYVFISGYALVKISGKISHVLQDEGQGESWGQGKGY